MNTDEHRCRIWNFRFQILHLCLSVFICGSACFGQTKKLIEFGWDEPDTAYLRQHIAVMEQTPFDGCVYHLSYDKPDGKRGDFLGECWGKKSFTRENFA